MEELQNKRLELKALLTEINAKKEAMESMVATVQDAIKNGMEFESKELDELRAIAEELTTTNLQATVNRLVELKTSVQESIQPLIAISASNNEFAATVLESIKNSGSVVEEVQGLFGELEAEIEKVKGVLGSVGIAI